MEVSVEVEVALGDGVERSGVLDISVAILLLTSMMLINSFIGYHIFVFV